MSLNLLLIVCLLVFKFEISVLVFKIISSRSFAHSKKKTVLMALLTYCDIIQYSLAIKFANSMTFRTISEDITMISTVGAKIIFNVQ